MQGAGRSSPWTWEELYPGLSFGPHVTTLTEEMGGLWRDVLAAGGARNATPPAKQAGKAILVPLMMRSFIETSKPRAPGNIHVSQSLAFSDRPVRFGERLSFSFTVAERAERKGRGWVDIDVECKPAAAADAQPYMTGRMVLIWATRKSVVEALDA